MTLESCQYTDYHNFSIYLFCLSREFPVIFPQNLLKNPIKRHCHVAIDGTFLQFKGKLSRFCGWEDEAYNHQIRRTTCCLGRISGSCGRIVIKERNQRSPVKGLLLL